MPEEAIIEDIPQIGQQDPTDPPRMKQEHRAKLDSIVQKMLANRESDGNIRMVVDDFKRKYAAPVEAPKVVQPEPPKFSWKTPSAQPMTSESTATPKQFLSVPKGLSGDVFNDEVEGAAQRINSLDLKPEIKKLLSKNKREADLQDTFNKIPIDNTDNAQLRQQIQHLLPKPAGVSEEEINNVAADLPNNPGFLKEAVHERGKTDPAVKADAYRLDASDRVHNAGKIAKNAKAIEKGELDYDTRTGTLIKPVNAIEAAAIGWGERKRLLNGYQAMDGKTDEEKIAYLKGDVPKRRDEDDPIPDTNSPAGFLGETVGSEGVPMSKSIIAGGAVQASGSLVPGIGNAVTSGLSAAAAAAASSPEYFKRSYYGTLQNEFHALTEQGMPEKEALAEAEHRAKVGAIADVAANGAMNFVGVRSGLKPAKFGSEYMGVVKKLSKSEKDFIKESIPEAAGVGAIGAGAQAVKNIDKGADASEGIDEAFLHNAAFVVGIKSLTRAGSTLFNKVKDAAIAKENIVKQPDEVIHQKVGEMLQDGSITPEEANEALTNIAAAKQAEEPEPGATNIKHATLKSDAESRELGALAEKTGRTFTEISAKADELIRKGETANIIEAVKKGDGITTDQKAVLIKTKSAIDKEYDNVSREYDDAVLSGNEDLIKAAEEKKTEVGNQALDIYNVAKKAGSEAGLSLVTQKINAEADYSIGEMLSRKQEAKAGKRMSKEERDNVEKQHKSMTEKEKKIKDKGKQMADAIRKLRINKGDNLQSNILAIPVAVWDGAVTTLANAVELGANLADAINEGVKHIKDNGGFKNKGDERKFRNHILNAGKEPDRLANFKSRTKSAIEGVKEKIANKDFEKAEKTPLELDKEAMDLRVELQDTRHQFDVEVLKDEMDKENWYQRNITKNIRKGIGTIKAVTSGIDDSAVAIQNYLAILANPKIAASSLKEHALDAFSQKRFDRQLAALHNSEHWELMKESGLDVLEPQSVHESLKEELMANSFHNDEINIKLKGKKTNINPAQVLKPFERAFTSLGNNIRTKLFLQQAETLLSEGKTFRTHPEEFKSLARVINEITARGKQNKYIELANPVVTAAIWSPKLLASGFNALGISDLVSFLPGAKTLGTEGFYRKLTPRQRKFALAQVGKGLSIGISVMTAAGIAKSMGADVDVDYDPRSVTFGEIRRGNKSVNVFGRFSPIIKVLVQSTLSKRLKNGKEQDLDSGDYGKKNVGGLVGSFFRGKMTPIAGLVYDYKLNAKKHFFTNEEMTMANTLKQLGPISLQGLGKGLERDGSLYLLNDFLPNFVGLNVKDKRDFEKQKKSGKPTRPKSPKAPKKPE